MPEILKTVGLDPSRDYANPWTALAAYDAYDFNGTGDHLQLVLYDDTGEPFIMGTGDQMFLDNTLTGSNKNRRVGVAAGHEYNPVTNTGVRILKTFDPAAVDFVFHQKRETAFELDGGIGIFVTCLATSAFAHYAIRLSGPEPYVNAVYLEYVPQGIDHGATAIRIDEDSAAPSSVASDIRVHHTVIVGNVYGTDEGFARGVDVEASVGVGDMWIQNNTAFRLTKATGTGFDLESAPSSGSTVYNNVAIECASLCFSPTLASGGPTSNGNISDDDTGDTVSTGLAPDHLELFVAAESRDFRPRHGSVLLTTGLAIGLSTGGADTSKYTLLGYLGEEHDGNVWNVGAFEDAFSATSAVPTPTVTNIGYGNLHEHPETWERGTRGSMLANDDLEEGLVTPWPDEPYTFDNDCDSPEDLSQWTASVDAKAVVVDTGGTPWGFGIMYELASLDAGAAAFAQYSETAGNMANVGDWNCYLVIISQVGGGSDPFSLGVQNTTDLTNYIVDFQFSGGVPSTTSVPGNVTAYIRSLGTVATVDYYAIQINVQSQATDISADARSLFITLPDNGHAGPWDGYAMNVGFVRCVTRTADVEIGYCSGQWDIPMWATNVDRSRKRRLVTADADRFRLWSTFGVLFQDDAAGNLVHLGERFFELRGVGVEQQHNADVDRRAILITAPDVVVDACTGIVKLGAATVNDADVLKIASTAYVGVLVSNCIFVGAGTPAGAVRGVIADAGSAGKVLHCTVVDITGGASAEGLELVATGEVFFRNCIVVDCDTDINVDEEHQSHNVSSDTTALGLGSQISIASSSLFNGIATEDYRLVKTASALDSGKNTLIEVPYDLLGSQRGAPTDIGAFEGFAYPPEPPAVQLGYMNRLCKLFELRRQDGVVYRHTDCNAPIDFRGQTFTPSMGGDLGATRSEIALRERSNEFVGVVSTDADDEVTADDLRAGRYRDARMTEFVVDWRYPWATPIAVRKWIIHDITFTGEVWKATVVSSLSVLGHNVGTLTSKKCRYNLGDQDTCTANILSDTQFDAAITNVQDARKSVRAAAVSAAYADDFFAHGKFTVRDGLNVGIVGTVKSYVQADREFTFQNRLPYDLEVGDHIDFEPGCAKTRPACITFDNIANFGGEPDIPGTDKSLATPTQ